MSLLRSAQSEFETLVQRARGSELSFREEAWEEYRRLGLPDRKTEAWKYTSLAGLLKRTWRNPGAKSPVSVRAMQLRSVWGDLFDVVVIQNGELREGESHITDVDFELNAPSLAPEGAFEDGFLGISAALSRPGLGLRVKGKARRPLMILHALSGDAVWSKSYHRLRVEAQAELDVVEWFIGDGAYLRSDLMRVEIGCGASVNWVRIQDEDCSSSQFSDVRVSLAEASVLNVVQVHCGGAWTRSKLAVDLRGCDSEARVSSLIFARDRQHVDQRIVANHWAAQSSSAQLCKGILKDKARGIVNGRIFIAKDAQKVNSSHLNHNLLLTPGAEANTKPELEIYADDVKASHGASVGRLDREKLFYLESRGIRREEGMQILTKAFVGDVLMKVTSRVSRQALEMAIADVLPGFAQQMEFEP
jgi:Fe-S cluster assembly protein SufD